MPLKDVTVKNAKPHDKAYKLADEKRLYRLKTYLTVLIEKSPQMDSAEKIFA